MMKNFLNFILQAKWSFLAVVLLGIVVISSCKEDDPEPADNPIASFQYEVSVDNFLEVVFNNFSQNAVSYNWDFGDGNTSTEESPTYTYATAGTYTVVLTATGAEGTSPATKSETVTLNDPNEQLTLLAGLDTKVWYLNREGLALGIGPEIGNNDWWSFGEGQVTPGGDRPCILDDNFVFHRDGTFELNTQGNVFADGFGSGGWLETEQCVSSDETDLLVGEAGEDLSVYATGGSYQYTYDPVINSLIILGEGSYIGLPNKTNGGDNYVPVASKEYVTTFVDGATIDSLHLAMVGDGFVWNFYLVSYDNEADVPDLPAAEPTAGFSFTKEGNVVTFANSSKNATSYMWDFGDGGSSTEESPVYTYSADGDYTVTLTAMDDNGASSTATQVVTITSAVFTAATLSNAEGKIWKMAATGGSFYVGGSAGSGEWWGGIPDEEVAGRECMWNDEFIFFDNGDFVIDVKDDVFAEPYMGLANGCYPTSDLVAPYDGLASGNHTFEATDDMIRVIGNGAYMGFSKGYNGGEYSGSDTELQQEISYVVFDYASDDVKETIWVTVDISAAQDGTGWWTAVLESYK